VEKLWERVREGRHTAIIGPLPTPPPGAFCLLRVGCDVPRQPLAPVLEAQRKAQEILGSATPLIDQAADRVLTGLRRRLLGDFGAPGAAGPAVEVWNRLQQRAQRPSALCFEAIERADPASLTLLRDVLSRPGWLRLPLILCFRAAPAPGTPAAALLALIRGQEGEAGVLGAQEKEKEKEERPPVQAPEPAAAAPAPASAETAREVPPPPETESRAPEARERSLGSGGPDGLAALPGAVLRVLRAGALIGPGFEAELVAALLGIEPLVVLEILQAAADAGVPLSDQGDGRFHLPPDLLEALRASILPSLAVAWHRRLATLLSPPAADEGPAAGVATAPAAAQEAAAPAAAAPREEVPPSARSSTPAEALLDEEDGEDEEVGEVGDREAGEEAAASAVTPATPFEGDGPQRLVWPYVDVFGSPEQAEAAADPPEAVADPAPAPSSTTAPDLEEAAPPTPQAPPPSVSSPAASRIHSPARAASHHVAAGEIDSGVERLLAAARQAAQMGAHAQALEYIQEGLAHLAGLPLSTRRRLLQVHLLAELGRLRWEAAGPTGGSLADGEASADFTLGGALEALMQARKHLEPSDPLPLRAEVAGLIASVYYDIGDLRSLERSLDELVQVSRELQASGDAYAAARLLNDQAAVYVRLGDPVRAAHLLEESRKVFERRADTDEVAVRELAETYHLLARLPLHVAARPGREADAVAMGRDHARMAESLYRRLGMSRELARVHETFGQLELRAGRLDRAAEHLGLALQAQGRLQDAIGLARTAATLSAVLLASGQVAQALALLGESVALNHEKGSPLGLAYNRRSLDALLARLPARVPEGLRAQVAEVAARLEAAEEVLGRLVLPGESDGK
jgi:tetratricopeptide (TPR) repeat protein